jgi:hypothetical protein
MARRKVVIFISDPSAANENPVAQVVYRGSAANFEQMWDKCRDRLPEQLLQLNGSGTVLFGLEGEDRIEKPKTNDPAGKKWRAASCPFKDFFMIHATAYLNGEVVHADSSMVPEEVSS